MLYSQKTLLGLGLVLFCITPSFSQLYNCDSVSAQAQKLCDQRNFSEAISLIDSSIYYYTKEHQNVEAQAFLETEKARLFYNYFEGGKAKQFIDSALVKYRQGSEMPEEFKGVLWLLKARVYMNASRFKEARDTLKAAVPFLAKKDVSNMLYYSRWQDYLGEAYHLLGNCAFILGKGQESIDYIKKTAALWEKSSPNYVAALSDLAFLHAAMGKCDSALAFVRFVEENITQTLEDEHILVSAFSKLTHITFQCKDYPSTIRLADSAKRHLALMTKPFRKSLVFLGRKAEAAFHINDSAAAVEACLDLLPLMKDQIISESVHLSSEKRLLYIANKVLGVNIALSILQFFESKNSEIHKQAFELALFSKDYSFQNLLLLKEHFNQTKDSSFREAFKRWTSVGNAYYGQLRHLNKGNKRSMDSLSSQMNRLREEMMIDAKISDKENFQKESSFEKVKMSLKEGEIAVEFIRYRTFDDGVFKYGAFVVTPQRVYPEFVFIASYDSLWSLLRHSAMESDFKYVNRIYENTKLYKLVWERILNRYPETSKIYASLAGGLSYISHTALMTENKQRLGDGVKLAIVLNSRDIGELEKRVFKLEGKEALLYGGLEYSLTKEDQGNVIHPDTLKPRTTRSQPNWDYLRASEEEVEKIAQLISPQAKVKQFKGLEGSEVNFKKQIELNPPSLIHVASHNLYINDGKRNGAKLRTYSYVNSGLVLSGANSCMKADGVLDGYGDGLLTAPEINLLNLSQTKLVVLSACNSGLGDYSYYGNVFGLHHAFKIAGAESVIYSLWKVSDEVTKEFMLIFYEELKKGGTIESAFYTTQEKMKKKYSVYYWASFQLLN
jgi:CHAT domain-containing protein